MRITGVIQAGGRSVRMGGRPKALMELGGRRIIDRVADVVRAVADDALIVTNTPELYASLGLPMVPDAFPDHGSLGGIWTPNSSDRLPHREMRALRSMTREVTWMR